jgi:hypothetical protein
MATTMTLTSCYQALHEDDAVFRQLIRQDKFKQLAKHVVGHEHSSIVQSMYIFKVRQATAAVLQTT